MNAVKPQPQVDESHTVSICNKCGGTGFWCQGVVDGRPVSNTGFQCFSCNGTGWKTRRKPRKKSTCPHCGFRVSEYPHYYTKELPDGTWGPIECSQIKRG